MEIMNETMYLTIVTTSKCIFVYFGILVRSLSHIFNFSFPIKFIKIKLGVDIVGSHKTKHTTFLLIL